MANSYTILSTITTNTNPCLYPLCEHTVPQRPEGRWPRWLRPGQLAVAAVRVHWREPRTAAVGAEVFPLLVFLLWVSSLMLHLSRLLPPSPAPDAAYLALSSLCRGAVPPACSPCACAGPARRRYPDPCPAAVPPTPARRAHCPHAYAKPRLALPSHCCRVLTHPS